MKLSSPYEKYANLRLFFIINFLTLLLASACAAAENKPASKEENTWEIPAKGGTVSTSIAAFQFQGRRPSQQLNITDLDIYISDKKKRLVPLLRILRAIKASGTIKDNTVSFKFEKMGSGSIDISQKILEAGGKNIPIDIVSGISDMTRMGEIYVSEEILSEGLGLKYVWDDELFQYSIKTDQELDLFKRDDKYGSSLFVADVKEVAEPLLETEPLAQPGKKSFLQYMQIESRTDVDQRWQNRTRQQTIYEVPALTAWGNAFNGDYQVKLQNRFQYPNTEFPGMFNYIDRAFWTSRRDDLLVQVGDTNLGLNDIVAPSASILGMNFKWFPLAAKNKSVGDAFFNSYRSSFLSVGVFDGKAPMGATVELWVNNRLLATDTIDERHNPEQGYGYYKFEGIGLMDQSMNDVRIVVKRTDGKIEEVHKEVLGVNQLLPAGQMSVTGGAGTQKQMVDGQVTARGKIAGAEVLYGLSNKLTAGFSLATQDKFAQLKDDLGNYYAGSQQYFLSQEARWQASSNLFFKQIVGMSMEPDTNRKAVASIYDMEYYFRQAKGKVTSQLFSFAPGYSNGINSIADRQGYNLIGRYELNKQVNLKTGLLHISNNLNKSLAVTEREDFLTYGVNILQFIPRSSLGLLAGRMDRVDSSAKMIKGDIFSADLRSRLTRKLNSQLQYTLGKNVDTLSSSNLKYGLPVEGAGYFYNYGWTLSADYALTDNHTLSGSMYRSNYRRAVELNSYYNHQGGWPWRSRFQVNRDLITFRHTFHEYLDFNMDKNGYNKWGIKAGYEEEGRNFDIGFYVTIKDFYFFNKGKFKKASLKGMSPERGAIDGMVYLDLNCNGHRDAKEPPVPDIDIMVDGKPTGKSGKDGGFVVPRRGQKETVSVSLDRAALPAIYVPTQGAQQANWQEGKLTSVNLGVFVPGSVSGALKAVQEGGALMAVTGARVLLLEKDGKTIAYDSVTADDGSFYIGQIKPGQYYLSVDTATIEERYKNSVPQQAITIKTGLKPHDIENLDITLKP